MHVKIAIIVTLHSPFEACGIICSKMYLTPYIQTCVFFYLLYMVILKFKHHLARGS